MVFLDTEFTNLSSPELLSFSMVSLDKSELYVELDLVRDSIGQARLRASSRFVREVVIPQFGLMPASKCSAVELGSRAGQWLIARAADARDRVTVAHDFDGDFVLLRHAMEEVGIWDRVRPLLSIENISSATGRAEGGLAAEASWLESSLYRGLKRHHALADALALRAAWLAVRDR